MIKRLFLLLALLSALSLPVRAYVKQANDLACDSEAVNNPDGLRAHSGRGCRSGNGDTYSVAVISADTARGTAAVGIPGSTSSGLGWVEVEYGSTVNLAATPKPGYHFACWQEADSVYSRTADTSVTVTGDRFLVAIFAQDSHEWVDMGDGLLWATCNVGAANPWDYGDYFAWGETQPKATYSWNTYLWGRPSTMITRYTGNDYNTLLPEDDAAAANWGGECRIPTREEWAVLRDTNKYRWEWTDSYIGSGVAGIIVTRSTGRCTGNSIFLPAARYKQNSSLTSTVQGYYWSSTLELGNNNQVDQAYSSQFYSSNFKESFSGRFYGNSVRPVQPVPTCTVAAASDNDTMGSAGVLVITPGTPAATSQPSMNVGYCESVSISATANPGYHFVEWREADSVYSRAADTTATVTADRLFTAVFAPDTYSVAVISVDTARGTAAVGIPGSTSSGLGWVEVEYGSTVNLTATPKPGYHFAYWHEDDSVYSRSADTSVTVTGDRFLLAVFEPDTHNVIVICNDTSMGSAGVLVVTPGAPAATSEPFAGVEHGATISIAAAPKPGYRFVRWEEADTVYSLAADTVATVTADRSFTAVFETYPHDYVDMGDGLWWATCNVGADNPWDFGDYFAWGETESKNIYSWDTYIWGRGGSHITRYNNSDHLTTLLPGDDAATANWGGGWRMPTADEFTALCDTDNYSSEWISNYNGTGKKGLLVTRLTGPCAGNAIFLPAAGSRTNTSNFTNTDGAYRSSSIFNTENAYYLSFNISIIDPHLTRNPRYIGYSVRAVMTIPTYSVFAYTADTSMGNAGVYEPTPGSTAAQVAGYIDVVSGSTVNLTATPKPGYRFVHWEEADTVYSLAADTTATVAADRFFTAVFDIATHNISVATNDTMGSATVTYAGDTAGSIDVAEGAVCTLVATANPCHHFSHWTKGADTVSVEAVFVFNVSEPGFYVAHFVRNDTLQGDTTAVVCDSLVWYGVTYTSTIEASHTTATAEGCDSLVTLHLTVNHSTASDTSATVCDSLTWYGVTYTSTGTASRIGVNTAGCDSTHTLHLKVNHSNTGDTTAVECDQFTWHGETYTTSSTASHTGTNAAGCDSTVTLHLTVNYSTASDTTAVACDSLVWYGVTYTTSNSTANHTITNAAGCDSTVTLHLTVNYSTVGDTSATVCDSLTWYNTTYTATATPTHLLANALGCDSTLTLHLTVNYSNTGDTTAVECNQFTWHGETYTTSGMASHTGTNAAGCDSTVTLHLTINYQNTGDTTAVECDHFSWYEHTGLTASVDTLTHLFAGGNQWGCDSTVTLNLTINYQNTGDTTAVECDQFGWYEHTGLTASVDTLTHLLAGANQWGCDSTVTLHLTVNYQNTGDTTAVECDQFGWYEHTGLTASVDTLTHLFAGANRWGCDSTVTLHLTINYQNTGDTSAVECDRFDWYEHQNLTTTQTASHLFAGANQWGCDSTVTLSLVVNYSNASDTSAVACDHFVWYATDYTATGEPTHVFTNIDNCDSTVTLHLTVNYQNTGDTTAVVCDQFAWYGTDYNASAEPTHLFAGGNQWGCDSTLTLHLTVNYQNTGDTTAVECDQFSWYDYTGLTSTINTLTHLLPGGNQWGCDSTVTLHLTVNYQNTGDTTAVECDQFGWYEHTSLTASVDTLTHLFAGGNQWGCDSTVTLHLTVNYQNTGDTTAVECDRFDWYEHHNLTTSSSNRTHIFAGANRWGCDSTVTLHLTVNYQNTGDTTAVECDRFDWYEHQNLTTSSNNHTHIFAGANQWGCDSTVTLHLTVHYQNTGDTAALTYEPYDWYEHQDMDVTQNVQHTFTGANQWGCDSTVTLHLRYALFAADWAGATTVVYNSQPQTGLGATYVDDTGRVQPVVLTFTKGVEVITSPDYPTEAGVWNVVARPVLPVDSLSGATNTLTILPATVFVTGASAQIAKVVNGNATAEVTDIGTLNNVQGNDALTHTTTAVFNDSEVGEDKTITLSYTLQGTAELLNNYVLDPASEVFAVDGAILDPVLPSETGAFDVATYGYCFGTGTIGYHLASGNPDQYKLDFADSRIEDVDWTDATGADGNLVIQVPEGLPTGDYAVTVTFRDHRYPWIESAPLTATFHVDLSADYVKPLFNNVIALVDTCQCFSDIQWYHRELGGEWAAIPGATGFYYRQESGLTGEYFVSVKMDGVATYTCPQGDLLTLVSDDEEDVAVSASPNPASTAVTLTIAHSAQQSHLLRVVSTVGVEMERRVFDGPTTTLDLGAWPDGSYVVSIDGYVVRIVKQ